MSALGQKRTHALQQLGSMRWFRRRSSATRLSRQQVTASLAGRPPSLVGGRLRDRF
jgi:hypothetical protein